MSATLYSQIDRTKKPEPQATPKLQLPKIQRATLSNGLSLMLVEHHELPVVYAQLVFQTGAAKEEKSGTANLTAQMLKEGTSKRTSLQIADDIEFIGAEISIGSNYDATFASLLTVKEHLNSALEIYSDILLHPTFPEKEWERVKKTHLTGLLQQKDNPRTVANNVYSQSLYGANHPYGRPAEGTETSVNNISLADLQTFYHSNYKPNNATLIIVGDITVKEIVPLWEKYFAQWKKEKVTQPTFSTTPTISSTSIYLIDKPQAAQSEIRIGHIGVARNNEDYFPLVVMNNILGGQFTSRINLNLREAKGYTYGSRSGFSMRKMAGPFTASAAVKTDVTDSSVIEFMKELNAIRNADVTEKELSLAKNSMVRSQPQDFETPQQIAGQLTNLVLYNLPDDYFNTSVQKIEQVTMADVRRVAEKYLNPKAMNIVIVGDKEKIQSGLEKLGYGKVNLLDTEGNSN